MLRALVLVGLLTLAHHSWASDVLVKWVISRSGGELTPSQALSLIRDTRECAAKHEVSERLVWQVMAVESSFDRRAVSQVGAQGLMQVMRRWHPEKVKGRSLFNQKVNVCVGAQILAEYISRYRSVPKALHAYNGLNGRAGTYARKVLAVKVPPLSEPMVASAGEDAPVAPHSVTRGTPLPESPRGDWYQVIDFLKSARSKLTRPPSPELVNAKIVISGPEGAYRDRIALH